MSDLSSKLNEDLIKAKEALTELDFKRASLDAQIEYIYGLLAIYGENQDLKPYANMTAIEAAIAVLEEMHGPLKVAAIVNRAIQGGYGGNNADFLKVMPTFSTTISRYTRVPDSKLIRLEKGKVGLRGRDDDPFK